MCITEDKLVDCYETGLFNRILFEVEYNRRKKNDDDLGVRIQTSHRSDPTAAKAIEHRWRFRWDPHVPETGAGRKSLLQGGRRNTH